MYWMSMFVYVCLSSCPHPHLCMPVCISMPIPMPIPMAILIPIPKPLPMTSYLYLYLYLCLIPYLCLWLIADIYVYAYVLVALPGLLIWDDPWSRRTNERTDQGCGKSQLENQGQWFFRFWPDSQTLHVSILPQYLVLLEVTPWSLLILTKPQSDTPVR